MTTRKNGPFRKVTPFVILFRTMFSEVSDDFFSFLKTENGVMGRPRLGATRQRNPTGTVVAGNSILISKPSAAIILLISSLVNVRVPPSWLYNAGAKAASHSIFIGAIFLAMISCVYRLID